MTEESLECGALLPVLCRATHDDLTQIVIALNKGLDVFITWDERYKDNQVDLTKIPEVIAEYIRRAGGHSIANRRRGSGPEYAEIVRDVCVAMRINIAASDRNVVEQEERLLKKVLEEALKGLTDAERADIEARIRKAAGKDLSIRNILTGGAQVSMMLPFILSALAEQALMRSLAAGAQMVAVRLAGGFLGPIALALGSLWLAHDLAGPSYCATIPAVICVALLRQRMMWNPAP